MAKSVIKKHISCDQLEVGYNSATSYLEFFDLIVAYAKEHGKENSSNYINLYAEWRGHTGCNVTGIIWGFGNFVLLQIIPQQKNNYGIVIADNTSGSTRYYIAQTTQLT